MKMRSALELYKDSWHAWALDSENLVSISRWSPFLGGQERGGGDEGQGEC
jgi:hypothetical protein